MHQKPIPDPLLIVGNNPKQPWHARNYFENKMFWKWIIKSLKKATFFLNPVSFNGQNYQKQKGPGTSNQLLFRLKNKFRKIPVLIMYYLTKFDDIIQSSFWVTPKIILQIYASQFKTPKNIPLAFALWTWKV